jgi:putative ABC transport system permease protein
LNELGTVDSLVSKSIATNRFATVLASSFALLALVLALVGIYGVLSYAVAQATQEIGIRMALGAHRGDVLRLVAAHAGMLVGIGFAIGLAAALAIGQVLAASLYQVRAEDPLTYVCVGLVLVLTAMVACLIPALRATRVNPLVALREE